MSSSPVPDITSPRTVGPILGATWRLWRSRPSAFILIALVIVVPVELILTGLLGGGFSDRYGEATPTVAAIDQLVVGIACSALISATHARAVVLLAAGERPTAWQVLRVGFTAMLGVIAAVLIYTVLVMLGTIALVIPGIWVATVGAFTAQVKALTGSGILESFTSSGDVVRRVGWWRTFGVHLLLGAIGWVLAFLIALLVATAVELIDDPGLTGPIAVVGVALLTAVLYSWTALASTVQYFAWRARAGDPWGAPAERDPELERGEDWMPAGHSATDFGAGTSPA